MECNIKYQDDGELLPVFMFFLKQLRRKPIRYFLYVLCFEGTAITITQFYYILKLFNLKDFLQYIIHAVPCFFGVATIALLLAGYNTFLQKINDFKFNFYWNIEKIGDKNKKSIIKDCITLQISLVMRLILSLSSAISWTVFWHQNENKLLLWPLVVSRYPEFAWPFRICIDVFFVVTIGATGTIVSFRSYYVSAYLKYQIYMLIDCVNNTGKEFNHIAMEKLLNNNEYQLKVYQELRFLVKRHGEILSHHQWMQDNTGNLLTWLVFLYIMLSFSSVLWMIAENTSIAVILLVLITICIISFQFCIDGQHFSNASEKLSTAVYNMKWYCWNKKNQQIYLMFVLNSNRIIEIWLIPFTPVNHAWLTQFYKALYSVANLLIQH